MDKTLELSLSPVKAQVGNAPAQAAIFFEGNPTGFVIDGVLLEAALRVDERRFLMFVTDDIIYEEMLTILLLDLSRGIVDKLVIGSAYNSGCFEDLKVLPHLASFSFIGDTTWTVRVLPTPSLRLPFSDPRGVSRPVGLRKYIDISANPPPARANDSR
ncbi:hypothetical protein [Erwinia sp. E_sp_B04_7]|uniref:hypothetical protein n=1 Tax=unclassified Erwinia TaxID=2622719 RepID=UPI0030CF8641